MAEECDSFFALRSLARTAARFATQQPFARQMMLVVLLWLRVSICFLNVWRCIILSVVLGVSVFDRLLHGRFAMGLPLCGYVGAGAERGGALGFEKVKRASFARYMCACSCACRSLNGCEHALSPYTSARVRGSLHGCEQLR